MIDLKAARQEPDHVPGRSRPAGRGAGLRRAAGGRRQLAVAHRARRGAAGRAEEVVQGPPARPGADRGAAPAQGGAGRGRGRAGRGPPRARRAAGPDPEPARPDRRRRHGRGGRAARPDLGRAAAVRLRAARRHRARLAAGLDRHGPRRAAVRVPVRLPDRRRGAGRDGPVPVRHRQADQPRLPARAAARAGQRAGHVRHRLPAHRGVQPLRAGEGRPVPDRHLRGRAGRAARRGDARRRAELPARYTAFTTNFRREAGRGGQGHQGHVPGAPVRQGRDVRLLRARGSRASSTTSCCRTRRRSRRSSACPTG